jgi:hypothetical protein
VSGQLTAIAVLWMVLVLGGDPTHGHPTQTQQAPPTNVHAATARTLYQRPDTWYEFLLKLFNPNGIDYGQWFERKRRSFIEARLKNPYFLYSLSTTIALIVMAAVCAKLQIDHRRAVWITAEIVADIYGQDTYSRRVAEEAIKRYNLHVERCNRAIEHGDPLDDKSSQIEQLKGELACVASERDTATRERDVVREELRKKSEILADMSVRLEAATGKSGTAATKPIPALQGVDSRLVTHINSLQEQLYAERTNNRRLKGG